MKIKGVIWLDSVIDKIGTKHGVSQEEVRQILQGRAMFRFVENG
jgi:cupin superfamily acireductone dioxygenase involved in methionine salvage